MNNKQIFASNLNKYMEVNGKSRREVSEALGVSYFTFTDWVNGKKYPRMDKVEMLADYFGIKKSDLIEEKYEEANKSPDRALLTEKEIALLDLFNRVPEDKQKLVLQMIRVALESQE